MVGSGASVFLSNYVGYCVINFKSPGLRDWWSQRLSTFFVLTYFVIFMAFWMSHIGADFDTWKGFLLSFSMKVLLVLLSLSVTIHAAIGVWVVLTDYVKPKLLQKSLLIVTHTGLTLMTISVIYWMWSF